MLKSVTLQNNNQLKLAPLTILTGVNNSGKTTILRRAAELPSTIYVAANREQLVTPSNVSDSIKKWLDIMELGNLKSAGARYVFPILLAGTQLKQGQTLIIENPEIFLHPKNQMNLADFFISLVNTGHQVIIETQSELILNYFGCAIARGNFKNEDISIMDFNRDRDTNHVSIQIKRYDRDGYFYYPEDELVRLYPLD